MESVNIDVLLALPIGEHKCKPISVPVIRHPNWFLKLFGKKYDNTERLHSDGWISVKEDYGARRLMWLSHKDYHTRECREHPTYISISLENKKIDHVSIRPYVSWFTAEPHEIDSIINKMVSRVKKLI